MVDLREELSEFSYGYGITREIESLLRMIGLRPTPFLPSLVHEASIGCDVSFDKPGTPLLVQFKIGDLLQRFHRTNPTQVAPSPLSRPFWRFCINTAEPNGQFETLLKAEQDGADVYYAAPQFSHWKAYVEVYQSSTVLENSLLLKPSEIRNQLMLTGQEEGWHRVVYDLTNHYVCSDPARLTKVDLKSVAQSMRDRLANEKLPISKKIRQIFFGLDERYVVRREAHRAADEINPIRRQTMERASRTEAAARHDRLNQLIPRARSEDDAVAVALGLELWAFGIQTFFVTVD
jgi:hypothetical protein